MNQAYLDSVRLLLAVAPDVLGNTKFALKGGTGINLFQRNMPRLSVDLDLVLADHRPARDEAMDAISGHLESARRTLERRGLVCAIGGSASGEELKLFVERSGTRIKVEVNHVFRGTVLPVRRSALVEEAQNLFFADLEIPVLHPNELYGSKLVAAMDRQHPRDLFDVLELYRNGGLTNGIVECFVSYLAGHNRPVHEVLFANPTDIAAAHTNEFVGMTRETVSLDDLIEVRRKLFTELPSRLTESQRNFLLGLVECDPDWSLMACGHLDELPAIRWKQANLARLRDSNPEKFALQSSELKSRLAG
jgi:hypothetical protein